MQLREQAAASESAPDAVLAAPGGAAAAVEGVVQANSLAVLLTQVRLTICACVIYVHLLLAATQIKWVVSSYALIVLEYFKHPALLAAGLPLHLSHGIVVHAVL